MGVIVSPIGVHQGAEIRRARIESASGVSVEIIGYGARVRDWRVPVNGVRKNVVLGFEKLESYFSDTAHFGAIAGRVANRIGRARFTLNGREYRLPANEGAHHLHGGPDGLSKKVWALEADSKGDAVRLSINSPEGEMGYPGAAEIEVVFTLDGNRLVHEMSAKVSAPTPINLVQHHYFNLMGTGEVGGHRLSIAADRYTGVDAELIPTGEIRGVEGTAFDFRAMRPITAPDGKVETYDLNYVLRERRDPAEPVARVEAPDGSLTLKLWTDQKGLQFYNGAYLGTVTGGLGGATYPPYGGFCLEDQGFPDAVNHKHFPSVIVTPEAPYRHRCAIEIA